MFYSLNELILNFKKGKKHTCVFSGVKYKSHLGTTSNFNLFLITFIEEGN